MAPTGRFSSEAPTRHDLPKPGIVLTTLGPEQNSCVGIHRGHPALVTAHPSQDHTQSLQRTTICRSTRVVGRWVHPKWLLHPTSLSDTEIVALFKRNALRYSDFYSLSVHRTIGQPRRDNTIGGDSASLPSGRAASAQNRTCYQCFVPSLCHRGSIEPTPDQTPPTDWYVRRVSVVLSKNKTHWIFFRALDFRL